MLYSKLTDPESSKSDNVSTTNMVILKMSSSEKTQLLSFVYKRHQSSAESDIRDFTKNVY